MYRQNLIRFERDDADRLLPVGKLLSVPNDPPLTEAQRKSFSGLYTSGDAVSLDRINRGIEVLQIIRAAVQKDLETFEGGKIEAGSSGGMIVNPEQTRQMIVDFRKQQDIDCNDALNLLHAAKQLLENYQEQNYYAVLLASAYVMEHVPNHEDTKDTIRTLADLNLRIKGEKQRNDAVEKVIRFLIATAGDKYGEKLEAVIFALRQCMTRPVKDPEEE